MSENQEQKPALLFAALGLSAVTLIAVAFLFFKMSGMSSSKIGYVKSDVMIAQYKPSMAVQQRLQQESATVQKDLERRYTELQGINMDLERKSKVLSSSAMAPQVESFQRKQSEFYQMQQSFQQQVNQKQAQLMEPIFQDISNFISKYGKDNGYTMILGTPVEGMIVFGDAGNDLTEILLGELNAKVPPSMPVPLGTAADSTK